MSSTDELGPKLLPDRSDLVSFLHLTYSNLDPGGEIFAYCIALRGLGEKGTPGEGVFIDVQIVPPMRSSSDVDVILYHMQRWAKHGHGAFIVPAPVSPAALSDKKATEDRILQFTTILVDIDSGDTAAKLAWAVKYLGQPSMVVHSGGTTDTGHVKMHVYWKFTEPSSFVARIAAARKTLALKIGADAAFGRSTQIIRLPGSVYGKNGVQRPCVIASRSSMEYELVELLRAVDDMPPMEGITLEPVRQCGTISPLNYIIAGGGLDFVAFKKARGDLIDHDIEIVDAFTKDIYEGGDAERNRWSEFNRVAGKNLASARQGIITLEEACTHTETWMNEHMKPPWPAARFQNEWRALVELDTRNHPPKPAGKPPTAAQQVARPDRVNLDDWAIEKWTRGKPELQKFLVSKLIAAGVQHVLCAGGGIGKTNLCIELAMKIAAKVPGDGLTWLGMPIPDDAGGTVVILTMEDDKNAVHRRIAALDPDFSLRNRMHGRCIIVPMMNAGGTFRFIERERGTGYPVLSARWAEMLGELRKLENFKLLVIDTLNSTMHGDENNATIVNEYIQAVAPVACGELGGALIFTHHPRKPKEGGVKCYTPRDYLDELRGSGAVPAAVRAVISIWELPNYQTLMTRMDLTPKRNQLFYYGVSKANPDGFFSPDEVRVALRGHDGNLQDITERARAASMSAGPLQKAWMIKAVEVCAASFHPLTKTGASGFYLRRKQLPESLKEISKANFVKLVEELLEAREIKSGGKPHNLLDVPEGVFDRSDGLYTVDKGIWSPPDWERLYAFDDINGRVVEIDKMHPMARARAFPDAPGTGGNCENENEATFDEQ